MSLNFFDVVLSIVPRGVFQEDKIGCPVEVLWIMAP